MIELVLVYCLSSEPDQCLERRELREEVGSAIECNMKAQTMAQEFVHAHPRFRLQGWRCEVDRPKERPA